MNHHYAPVRSDFELNGYRGDPAGAYRDDDQPLCLKCGEPCGLTDYCDECEEE